MTSLPLHGLRVGLHGGDRPVLVAGRVLADLGADVRALSSPATDDADRLWLGSAEQATAGDRFDVLLRDAANVPDGVGACVIVYRPVSSTAAHAGQVLGEREVSAVGGMAIAVGDPQRPPLPMPEGAIDTMVGTHLASAALAAIRNGVKETEVAAADVVAWAVATNLHLYSPYGLGWFRAGRRASGSGSCYPYGLFEAADGPFCLIGRTDRDWQALRAAMGDPDWSRSSRFADPRLVGRAYPEEADAHVGPWAARHTREQLMAVMMAHTFPGAPVLNAEEVLSFPALADRWSMLGDDDKALKVPGPVSDHLFPDSAAQREPRSRIRVLDLSWVWSGPAVSVGLADLGADVIKIESNTRPDNSRFRGAPQTGVQDSRAPKFELAPYFHALNRGKRSVTLDLRTDGGRAVLFELAKQADVIIENLSVGVMDRFGISPERVLESNPSCVFLSMRGYREHPTTKGLRAYAPVLSSSAGLEAAVAYPGEAPLGAMTIAFSDALASSQGLLLALAGLYHRDAHGSGVAITLSQHEAAVLANGHNLVATQLGQKAEMRPFADDASLVTSGDALPESPWLSPDLFAEIQPRYLDDVTVARMPWRQDGALPPVGRAAPLVGEHTHEILRDVLSIDDGHRIRLARDGVLT